MRKLLVSLAALTFAACGAPTALDFEGDWTGTPKLIVTANGTVKDVSPSGSVLTLTSEGSSTLVSSIWSSTCPLKFTQGSDPMKFELTTTGCTESDGATSEFKTGTLNFPTLSSIAMDVSGNITTASGGTGTFTLTFSGSK